jgi:beta-mannosidase
MSSGAWKILNIQLFCPYHLRFHCIPCRQYQFRLPATLSKYLNSDPETMPDVPAKTRERLFDTFCYLTQCVQARSITGQTEHYIRGRGEVYRTMGALYWQLNDIWPAPTCK